MSRTIWFTGLSGAGKSTLARALEQVLVSRGHLCAVLDGDELRRGLCCDLGYSAADRSENIRRAAEVARLFNAAGTCAIVALISPLAEDRALARSIISADRCLKCMSRRLWRFANRVTRRGFTRARDWVKLQTLPASARPTRRHWIRSCR